MMAISPDKPLSILSDIVYSLAEIKNTILLLMPMRCRIYILKMLLLIIIVDSLIFVYQRKLRKKDRYCKLSDLDEKIPKSNYTKSHFFHIHTLKKNFIAHEHH